MDVVFISSQWPDCPGIAAWFRQDGHVLVIFDDPQAALDHMIRHPPRILLIDYAPDPAARLILTKTARRLLERTLILVIHPQLGKDTLIDLGTAGIDGYIAGQPTAQDILRYCKYALLSHMLLKPSTRVGPRLLLRWTVPRFIYASALDLTIHLLVSGYVWDFREVYTLVIRSDHCN